MNANEAVIRAAKEPTLAKALSWICVWECERAIRQAMKNPQWETCFEYCIKAVMEAWEARSAIAAPAQPTSERDRALEEAAQICDQTYVEPSDLQVESCHEAAKVIRALKGPQPTPLQHPPQQPVVPEGFVPVPVDAYLWLMGMGKDGFSEDRRGAFWWRSAFNERAGLDMMAIYEASRTPKPNA